MPDQIYPHTVLVEKTLPFVFVAKIIVWAGNSTTNNDGVFDSGGHVR